MKLNISFCMIGILIASYAFAIQKNEISREEYPFFKGFDTYEMKVSVQSTDAQKYFNQGILLYYGYNFPEAAKSFSAAATLEPKNGICNWGRCLSLCDCVDNPGDKWHREALQAYTAATKGQLVSNKELDLIETLSSRFEEQYDKNESPETLFATKMKHLHEKYPDDPDILAIYVNGAMKAYDMTDRNPKGDANVMIAALEEGLKRYPQHPGLNHFYIHAMEAAGTPEKALKAAIHLDGAVPGSGHLQHMPAHIYFLYGRYHDATRANQSGIDADDQLFKEGGIKNPEFAGFYLHNYYFLFDSLMIEGRSEEAVVASQKILKRLQEGDLPSNPFLIDVFSAIPFLLQARSGMWNDIYYEMAPPENLVFATAARDYALGLAALRTGRTLDSYNNLKALNHRIAQYEKQKEAGPYSPALFKVMQIAAMDLAGQIDNAEGNRERQIETLNKAISIEDTLDFHMLPWYMYMRHALGEALIAARRPEEAEKVYREDLKRHPNNGWALFGMVKSLEAQQKFDESKQFRKQFDEAWKYADLKLLSSRF